MHAQANAVAAETVAALDAHAAEVTQRLKALRTQFHGDITDAMAGRTRTVRCVRTIEGQGDVSTHQSATEAVLDALDLTIVGRDLLNVLRDSQCPLVAHLKTKIAGAFVAQQMRALGNHVVEARTL